MSKKSFLQNVVRGKRKNGGAQQKPADRIGLSHTGISVEEGRPATAAALALAGRTLGT
jgi:hypothetical protein